MLRVFVCVFISLFFYFGGMYYISKRYGEEVASMKQIFGLQRKRNQCFAALFLILSLCIGVSFSLYNISYMTLIQAYSMNAMIWLIAYIDYKEKVIPNVLLVCILCLIAIFFLIRFVLYPDDAFARIFVSFTGMFLAGGLFGISKAFSKDGIGMGDVKLMAVLGLYTGTYVVVAIMLVALLLLSMVGGIGILRKKIRVKEEIPFAPYVAVGTTVVTILGFWV